MTLAYSYPAAGTVRTTAPQIIELYQKASVYLEHPCLWEGMIRLACLIKNKPTEEPVAQLILCAIADTDNGSFNGCFSDQISIARAALALFEYNTDRKILKRLSEWIRYVEIEYDTLILQGSVLYRPADLMEMLVRFYQSSGVKAALRLSAKLRTDAFDWTTALHTFQQIIPLKYEEQKNRYYFPTCKPCEIDYDEKEALMNHAEALADGVRYALFSGLFSGHNRDLTAGKTVWSHLIKHHHALCGGTTGAPFLCGNAPDRHVSNVVIASWTEAFAAQMVLPDSDWAVEEIVRIVFNGLSECLKHPDAGYQLVNSIREINDPPEDYYWHYARITRAIATACSHAISQTEKGIQINYLIPGKYLFKIHKQPFIIETDLLSASFLCRQPVASEVDILIPPISTCSVCVTNNSKTIIAKHQDQLSSPVYRIHTDTIWNNKDLIRLEPDETFICEETHHQGCAFMRSNRLMCMSAGESSFAKAVCGSPVLKGGLLTVPTVPTEKWNTREGQPDDIPVLPGKTGITSMTELKPYSETPLRIAVFPKTR